MGKIEQLLCRLFPYTDIMRSGTNDLYLRRWFLHPRDKDFGRNKGKGRLYLHKFYRGDEDLHFHDHPWRFTSLILTRGYWEETPFDSKAPLPRRTWRPFMAEDGEERIRVFYKPFTLLFRPAIWKHRVVLKDTAPVWTIVKTGVKERNWGFWIKDKMCPWRQYDNGECLVEPIKTTTEIEN